MRNIVILSEIEGSPHVGTVPTLGDPSTSLRSEKRWEEALRAAHNQVYNNDF